MTALGDTFHFDPFGAANNHLWIAIGERTKDGARDIVIVSITTWHQRADETCKLVCTERGMHPFVKHESFVYYRGTMIVPEAPLDAQKANKRQRLSPELLARVQQGAHASPQTPRWLKAFVPKS